MAAGRLARAERIRSPESAGSIGGLVARGLAGGLRQQHLGVRDQIIGIGLLRSDGTSAKAGGRVVKNVAGYDLMRLLCGSWGSLASDHRAHPAGAADPSRPWMLIVPVRSLDASGNLRAGAAALHASHQNAATGGTHRRTNPGSSACWSAACPIRRWQTS